MPFQSRVQSFQKVLRVLKHLQNRTSYLRRRRKLHVYRNRIALSCLTFCATFIASLPEILIWIPKLRHSYPQHFHLDCSALFAMANKTKQPRSRTLLHPKLEVAVSKAQTDWNIPARHGYVSIARSPNTLRRREELLIRENEIRVLEAALESSSQAGTTRMPVEAQA